MPRSKPIRALSIAALLLAGSLEPAWQLGHAVLHLESAHDSHHPDQSRGEPDPTGPTIAGTETRSGHGHPVFQAPIRPGTDLHFSVSALPVEQRVSGLSATIVAVAFFLPVPARASPFQAQATRPRAPPTA